MTELKVYSNCVALLADMVDSRTLDRAATHARLLTAMADVNREVPALDPLRVTVGDEAQGVYAGLGHAYRASRLLNERLGGVVTFRFGLGGGEVRVVDAVRGIQDGSAWWLAREAIQQAEALATEPGYSFALTAVRDARSNAAALADPTIRLVEAATARLRPGARRSLTGLLLGLDNQSVAAAERISDSANSQRVRNNDLRALADAIMALEALP